MQNTTYVKILRRLTDKPVVILSVGDDLSVLVFVDVLVDIINVLLIFLVSRPTVSTGLFESLQQSTVWNF